MGHYAGFLRLARLLNSPLPQKSTTQAHAQTLVNFKSLISRTSEQATQMRQFVLWQSPGSSLVNRTAVPVTSHKEQPAKWSLVPTSHAESCETGAPIFPFGAARAACSAVQASAGLHSQLVLGSSSTLQASIQARQRMPRHLALGQGGCKNVCSIALLPASFLVSCLCHKMHERSSSEWKAREDLSSITTGLLKQVLCSSTLAHLAQLAGAARVIIIHGGGNLVLWWPLTEPSVRSCRGQALPPHLYGHVVRPLRSPLC